MITEFNQDEDQAITANTVTQLMGYTGCVFGLVSMYALPRLKRMTAMTIGMGGMGLSLLFSAFFMKLDRDVESVVSVLAF